MAKARKRPPRKRGKDRVRGSRVKDPVPVAPLRERVLELMERGATYAEICQRIGWVDTRGRADTTRLQRRLGLRPESKMTKTLKNGDRVTYGGDEVNEFVSYDRAVEICRALDLDPVDIRDPFTGESLL